MPVGVTFAQEHSDGGWWKILENIGIYLDSIITSVIKADAMVAYEKAFQGLLVPVTFVQGHMNC